MRPEFKYIIGVDEAGRGPLAGPVAVGVVLTQLDFDWALIPGVNDSKLLSEKKREEIYVRALELVVEEKIWCSVQMSSAVVIDTEGIVPAIRSAMAKGFEEILSQRPSLRKDEVMVKLDGSLHAPVGYTHQETIIKGDSKEKIIGLASVMAKVTRDHYMQKIASEPAYQNYDFSRHKGYGTVLHRLAIATYGLSAEHRKGYCKNIKVC